MIDYRFTPDAEDDLFEIWCYIARDSVAALHGMRDLKQALKSSKVPHAQTVVCRFGDHALHSLLECTHVTCQHRVGARWAIGPIISAAWP